MTKALQFANKKADVGSNEMCFQCPEVPEQGRVNPAIPTLGPPPILHCGLRMRRSTSRLVLIGMRGTERATRTFQRRPSRAGQQQHVNMLTSVRFCDDRQLQEPMRLTSD